MCLLTKTRKIAKNKKFGEKLSLFNLFFAKARH